VAVSSAAQAIVDGNNVQYVVRFDGLVDHDASRMWITTGARVARTLTPNLNAAPEVLFASSPRLPPGNYQLRWSAKSVPDPDLTDGSIEFKEARSEVRTDDHHSRACPYWND
jgi:hypothetical protein